MDNGSRFPVAKRRFMAFCVGEVLSDELEVRKEVQTYNVGKHR